MVIPIFIQILIGALFGPALLKQYGVDLTAGQAATQQMAQQVQTAVPVPAATPNSEPETDKDPTANQIISKAVEKPSNWFGLALFAFALIFIFAQLRAAANEGIAYAGDAIDGAKSATAGLANADGSTGNISRRRKA
jgi:hypothetical protein